MAPYWGPPLIRMEGKYHKGQQLWLVALAVFPGILALLKVISPVQAGLVVMLAFVLSRRHANALQKQFEAEEAERKRAAEQAAVAPPSKLRNDSRSSRRS